MASKDSGKSTRISLACIACRSRKHRCSGEKPRCAQCISNNVSCEWPAQQKRGPPKQYIHSLETRLFETEAVLLSLLSQVSAGQLQASFQQISSLGMRHTGLQNQTEHGSESLTVNRPDICRPSYWNSFPINSPENVRRWWEDRTSDTNLRPFLIGSEKGPATNKPPAADEHVGISSLSGIADSNNPGSHQFTDTVEETSNMGIMNTDLQESASEAELGGDNTPRSNARHGSTGNIPFQHGSVHPREDATPVSNEDGEGVLKLPSQFKLDFVW